MYFHCTNVCIIAHPSPFWCIKVCRSASLKSLSLISCHGVTNRGFGYLIAKSPLLENLSLELCPRIGGRDIYESTGKGCPQLKSFSLHRELFRFSFKFPSRYLEERALEVMHELRSLSLIGTKISNYELEAILDSCPHLETLYLRDCYNVVPDSALLAKCARLKTYCNVWHGSQPQLVFEWLKFVYFFSNL